MIKKKSLKIFNTTIFFMGRKKIIFIFTILTLLLIFFVFVFPNLNFENNFFKNSKYYEKNVSVIINDCISYCEYLKSQDVDLSKGPCIMDPYNYNGKYNPDWVCDIAHNPRISIDNIASNQCNSFRNQSAKHFIELTPDCKFIRKY